MRHKIYIDCEKLKNLYIQQGLSVAKIAKLLHTSESTIFKNIKLYKLNKKDKTKNITNKRFGRLVSKYLIGKGRNKSGSLWYCECDCGGNKIVSISQLKSKKGVKSCGCLLTEHRTKKNVGEIHGSYWNALIQSAKSRNIPLEVDMEYIWDLFLKQDRKCYFTKLPLTFAESARKKIQKIGVPQTASLDRIDSSKGYVKNNLVWVHKNINIMKNRLKENEFILLCHLVSVNHQVLNYNISNIDMRVL